MLAPITYIQPLSTLRRRRTLPVEGHVMVNLGQMVRAGDDVARANLYSEHIMLDAGRALGVPPERIVKLLQRKPGEKVEEGDILAGRRGVTRRVLRAPASGRVAAVSGGQILLQVSDESARLKARVPGEVIDIEPGHGVVIECVCAWIQAAWGNGGLADGVLIFADKNQDHRLTADEIDMSQRGAIMIAGTCDQRQTLELAAQVPIRGLILGSMSTRLIPIAQKMPYPIVLTEGFGSMPMNADAHSILANHSGEDATLNAQAGDLYKGERPEIIIPLDDAGRPPSPVDLQSFRLGLSVRIVHGPHHGAVGEITNLLASSTLFASGIRAPGAEIALAGGGEATVPLANLEVLG
jgi:hypothetical protein